MFSSMVHRIIVQHKISLLFIDEEVEIDEACIF